MTSERKVYRRLNNGRGVQTIHLRHKEYLPEIYYIYGDGQTYKSLYLKTLYIIHSLKIRVCVPEKIHS